MISFSPTSGKINRKHSPGFCLSEISLDSPSPTSIRLDSYPNILLIGANARNAGKTTLACRIIQEHSKRVQLIGLKVTRFRSGEEAFHGDHGKETVERWTIEEEKGDHPEKDTFRLLEAGAERVFYLKCNETYFREAFEAFMATLDINSLVVCESRSLRRLIKPGIFILMLRESGNAKESAGIEQLADILCRKGNDNSELERIANRVRIVDNTWSLVGD